VIKNNLYIVWQDSFIQDEGILDEQHHALLATINSLHYFLRQGQGLDVLMPTVKILFNYLRFHSKTEEGILRAAKYPRLAEYIDESEEMISDFKAICRDSLVHKEPDQVLLFLRQWWQKHLESHEELALYLTDSSGQYCRLD